MPWPTPTTMQPQLMSSFRATGPPGQGTIGPGNTFWQNPNIPHEEMHDGVPHWHQFDPAKARKLLEDAGYRWDDEGNLHFPENHVPQLHYNG